MEKGDFRKSWKTLFHNFEIVLPDAVYLIFSLAGLLSVGKSTGFFEVFSQYSEVTNFKEILASFLVENIYELLISFAVFFVYNFLIGVGRDAWKYNAVRKAIEGKKKILASSWEEKKRFYKRLIGLRIKVYGIIITASALMGAMIAVSLYSGNKYLIWTFSIVSALLGVFLLILLLHRYAIMFVNDYDSGRTIKESFSFLKKHYLSVIFTFFVVFAANFVWVSLSGLFDVNEASGSSLATGAKLLVSIVMSLVIGAWVEIYVFNRYITLRKIYK